MSADCTDHIAIATGAPLPPVYSDLLGCARRMLQRAQARCWSSLLDEEVEFFRAYERVAIHESRSASTAASEVEQERFEKVHRDVARNVVEARRLLLQRQAELSSHVEHERSVRPAENDGDMEGYTLLL